MRGARYTSSMRRGSRRAVGVFALVTAAACGPSDRTSETVSGADGGSSDDDGDGVHADARRPQAAEMYVHSKDTLYVVDDQNFDLVPVGPLGMPDGEGLTDLAVTPDGSLYGISGKSLYEVSPITGAVTHIGMVPGELNVGLTFLPDGTLLATDKTGGVRRVDPADGSIVEVGAFGEPYATAGDLVAVADGTMYAISDQGPNGTEEDSNLLLVVDPENGEAVDAIGQIGYGRVFGCAYAGGKIYAFTDTGDIIEIDRNTGSGSLKRSFGDMSFWGAAVTPVVEVD